MSDFVPWIAAQADEEDPAGRLRMRPAGQGDEKSFSKRSPEEILWQEIPAHNFPASPPEWRQAEAREDPLDRNPDLWLYRHRTVALLRRYMRFSLETGRLPSMVGREFFRAKVSAYPAATFEDRVIFVRDVEKCLYQLEERDQQLLARVILQEHSHDQAARILHCTRKTVERRVPEALDLLSEVFLRVGMLIELPPRRRRI